MDNPAPPLAALVRRSRGAGASAGAVAGAGWAVGAGCSTGVAATDSRGRGCGYSDPASISLLSCETAGAVATAA